MRKLLAALFLSLALSGCAQFAEREAVIGCQVADTATTVIAVNSGAVEANPIMAGILNSMGWMGFLVFKAAITLFLLDQADKEPEIVGGATAATCGIAIHNLLL